MTLIEFDEGYRRQGYALLCGVDEAGRGPLAGPVYAGAVILPPGLEIEGLRDSKKLSHKQRERLYEEITAKAEAFAVALAGEAEIDRLNILGASLLAMRRAVERLGIEPDYVLADGNQDPRVGYPTVTVVGGDDKSASIAAASILAKVERDRWMALLDRDFPQYGFARHKGYPTKYHYQMLNEHGPCPAHRKTFLRKWEAKR